VGKDRCAIASRPALGRWLADHPDPRQRAVEIKSPQGMAAETSSAVIILFSSHLGMALSTTQVASGSILGSGVGRRVPVRWGVFGRMVVAGSSLCQCRDSRALCWFMANGIGGVFGVIVVFGIWCLVPRTCSSGPVARPSPRNNVNAEWEGGLAPVQSARRSRLRTEEIVEILTRLGCAVAGASSWLLLGSDYLPCSPSAFALSIPAASL
jgi:hypothetical protein